MMEPFVVKMYKILLFVWIFCATNSWAQMLEKGCRMSQLDAKFKTTTKLSKDVIWPENDQEVDEMCKSYPKHLSEARNFLKKCAKGEAKTILSVSTHAIEKMTVKLYCKGKNAKTEQRKLMQTAKCVNTGRKTASKCWTTLISSITAASNFSETKDRIPLLCCSLNRWKDCFVNTYERIGTPVCKAEYIEYADQYLYKSMIDPMNIFCADYEDSDKCNKFNDFFSKSVNIKVKYQTPFPSIINLFGTL